MMRHTNIQSVIWAALTTALMLLVMPAFGQDGPAVVSGDGAPLWQAEEVGDEFELPPPPDSALPPAVDLSVLRRVPMSAMSISGVETIVASASGARGEIEAILSDVSQRSGRQRMLEETLLDQLRSQLPGAENYSFDQVFIPEAVELPNGPWTVRYDFRLPSGGVGRATYTATLSDPQGGTARRFSGTVMIDRQATGLTVRRVVRRGERIAPEDLQELPARLTQLPRGALGRTDEGAGAVAGKELRPGEWLTGTMVAMPMAVKRGASVMMQLHSGMLSINAPGIARQDGRIGQVIGVTNAQSGREVQARVVSAEEVQVIF
jgi:flagella basal body P-ring formation protein FlgA